MIEISSECAYAITFAGFAAREPKVRQFTVSEGCLANRIQMHDEILTAHLNGRQRFQNDRVVNDDVVLENAFGLY